MSFGPSSSTYDCDPIRPPRLANSHSWSELSSDNLETSRFKITEFGEDGQGNSTYSPSHLSDSKEGPPTAFTPRKLCVRHQRMADGGVNLKLQQSLDSLPLGERESVTTLWANFSAASHPRRALILQGLLTMCCFSQLSLLTEQLAQLGGLDPLALLPREIALRIFEKLDATSLCRAAQVSRRWRCLADDNILWRGICEQHIGQKCRKCGWCLPVLERKRSRVSSLPPHDSGSSHLEASSSAVDELLLEPPSKRRRADSRSSTNRQGRRISTSRNTSPHNPLFCASENIFLTRPWKDVYSERLTIERNWRAGRCTVRTLTGHTDGVMCLQLNDRLSHPSYPILITGSYDRTARVWNLETGSELHCLKGHTRAIRALQFDEVKLITGSMDRTVRVWDWRKGRCIRTLEGHSEGVVCLNFDANVLASGGVDTTIKVWNLRTGGAFTLRGHCDWVNSVQLWDSGINASSSSPSSGTEEGSFSGVSHTASPQIDPGKMLFSASDDGTIRLWDLTSRTCVRQLNGHVGQVQSVKILASDKQFNEEFVDLSPNPSESTQLSHVSMPNTDTTIPDATGRRYPLLISGSLDNTIKLWDIETGKARHTLFGHIEGVWAVASDRLRLASGSHDRTIKVWNREDGRCTSTLVGHRGAVTSLALGEDKIVSGSDDGDIKIWSFSGQ